MQIKKAWRENQAKQEIDEWNQIVFGSLWRVFILSTVLEVILFILFEKNMFSSGERSFLNMVFCPVFGQFVVLIVYKLILEYGQRVLSEAVMPWISFAVVNVYAVILASMYTSITFWSMVFLIPVAVSSIFRKKIFIKVQVLLSAGFYFLYRAVFLPRMVDWNSMRDIAEVLIFPAMIAGLAVIVEQIRLSTIALDIQSWQDSLTHMYNHEVFYEELERRMHKFKEEREAFCILIADIDNFKQVNDTYGHAYGDKVICEVADVFARCKNVRDVAARYGGEEFAMILPKKEVHEAVIQADKIRKEFASRSVESEDGPKSFTLSIGVAEYKKPFDTASKFFELADKALYEAKAGGKNKVCCSK